MPVLITIATINVLFRSGTEDVGFLDPEALRVRCKDEIEDADTRERAVQLTDGLQRLAHRYEVAVTATVNAYLSESVKWESSASGLIALLQPIDSDRARTLQEIVRVRQSMRELLTVTQWKRVLG